MDTYQHIRAELQRVARQVRKLAPYLSKHNDVLLVNYSDVLDLIREAQR